ncbi:MAG: hypothetical protein HYV27_24635 [Candidatus Hydrogenedentes bacterium]|nr:hypothetical protein [Candidatus Hydrogenedentota bacterium]
MHRWVIGAILLGTQSAFSMPFLLPEDLVQPEGVRLEAQAPESGMQLIPKSPDLPSVWYAPVASRTLSGGVIQLWYQRVNKGEALYGDQRTLCVGEIRAGQWILPALHPEPPAWGGENNVCLRRSPHTPTWGGFNVFQLAATGTQLEMLYWDQPGESGEAGVMRAISQDGYRWEKISGAVFTEHNDAYSLARVGDRYAIYQTMLEPWPDKPYPDNLDKFKRVLCIRTSTDLRTWTGQEVLLRPDGEDAPETEFYLMKVFPYGRGYAGLIMKYYGDPRKPNLHSALLKYELAVSADGRAWQRPYRDADLGFWSYADPFGMDGKTHFAIWKDGAMETVAYAQDRLVAATADAEGSFATAPFVYPLTGLTLNADASKGWIALQLCDAAGTPLAGSDTLRVEGVNAVAHPLRWTLDRLPGECLLRVRLQHAKVFGFSAQP